MSSLRRNTPLHRNPIRRRPRRNRVLKTEDWAKLRVLVTDLDTDVVIEFAEKQGWVPILLKPSTPAPTVTMSSGRQVQVCPAVVMDPSELGNCFGGWNLDHVKDDLRMGVKADDNIWHLVSLCAGHDERGARGGSQWNTKSENRDKERCYLRKHRPERPGSGVSGA